MAGTKWQTKRGLPGFIGLRQQQPPPPHPPTLDYAGGWGVPLHVLDGDDGLTRERGP